jgi:hypothetical protein
LDGNRKVRGCSIETKKHELHCITCGHALSMGQEIDMFAQYATHIEESAPLDLLEEVEWILQIQQPQNSTYKVFLGFTAKCLSPLLFQLLETLPRVMAKTIQHLEPMLGL